MEQIKKEVLLGIGEVNIESFSSNTEKLNVMLNDAGFKEKINLKKEDSFEIDFPNISSLTQGVSSYLDGVIYHCENGFENIPASILNKIDVIKENLNNIEERSQFSLEIISKINQINENIIEQKNEYFNFEIDLIHHQESIDETINDIEQQNEIIDQINSELMAFEDGDYDTEYALQESESVLRDLSSQLAAQYRDFKQEVNKKEEFLKIFEEVVKPEIISNLQDLYSVFKNINLDFKKIVNKIDDLVNVIFDNKKDFGFYQPDEYLEKNFGISDFILKRKILNIGLIKNDNNEYGIELIENLANKNIISIENKKEILLNFQQNKSIKESLLPVLKEQGYIGIRYYESESMYLSSKQSFKFEDFGIIEKDLKSKKKQTPKI